MIIRQVFPFCAGSNAVIEGARAFVTDRSANLASLLHIAFPFHLSIPHGVALIFNALSLRTAE